jgi:sugar O-acyltransferase (sialic acid O-acetyltransferase NeuD family)
MNNNFTIVGAGGHAKVIIEIIEESGFSVNAIIDDNPKIKMLVGYEVTNQKFFDAPVIVAIGDNKVRKKFVQSIDYEFGKAIHPRANVSTRCKIGEGTVVMAGTTINSEVNIGKHCIINTNASVDHDCTIGDFVHISPKVTLAGNVTVDEGSHIGIGSTVIQGTHIGKWVTIGAGAVIIEDVPDYAVVVGVPGNIIRYNPSLACIVFDAIVVGDSNSLITKE